MPETQKSNSNAKWIVALVALLGLGGVGADAGGYDITAPDLSVLEKVGAIPAIALILYLHRYWYPVVKEAAGHLRVLVERSDRDEKERPLEPAPERLPPDLKVLGKGGLS
jgi:hypothetical protein